MKIEVSVRPNYFSRTRIHAPVRIENIGSAMVVPPHRIIGDNLKFSPDRGVWHQGFTCDRNNINLSKKKLTQFNIFTGKRTSFAWKPGKATEQPQE
jgi:hypothetical protein